MSYQHFYTSLKALVGALVGALIGALTAALRVLFQSFVVKKEMSLKMKLLFIGSFQRSPVVMMQQSRPNEQDAGFKQMKITVW